MESLGFIVSAFTTVFAVFLLGFAIQRLRPFDETTLTQLSWLVVNVLIPIYCFYATATGISPQDLAVAPSLIAAGFIAPLIALVLAKLLIKPFKVSAGLQAVFLVTIMMPSSSFFGFPICEALFGTTGVIYAVLYDFGSNLILLTLCVWLLNEGRIENWRQIFLNPILVMTILGLIWSAFGWPMPQWADAPLASIGGATFPLIMLVVGAQVGNIKQSANNAWKPQMIAVVLSRLIIVPAIIWGLLLLFGINDVASKVIVIESAMPVAIITGILARAYGANADFDASAIFWTSLLSIITLPLLAFLLLSF